MDTGRPLVGDEVYYVGKAAKTVELGRLTRASAHDLAVESGAWGTSDWRPPGYALFLALLSGGNFDVDALRARVTFAQFLGVAIATLLGFSLLSFQATWKAMLAAAVIGFAPWPFAFVTTIGPDSLNASVSFFGLYFLIRWARGRGAAPSLAAGSLLLSSTFLLRPEMIAIAPLSIVLAVVIRHLQRRTTLREWVLAGMAFVMILASQYAYRSYYVGRFSPSLFGGLHIYNGGLFRWANSWLGTEREAYEFVYAMGDGNSSLPLPARAFADDRELRVVQDLRTRVEKGGFGREIDAGFAKLAEERIAKDPIGAVVLPRIWHAVHVWINTETSEQLLRALTSIPRAPRRALLGLLLLLKVVVVAFFLIRVARSWKRWASEPVASLLASYVIARTVLVGLVLNWMVYRYLISAWLPLLLVVFLASESKERSPEEGIAPTN